MSDPDPTQWHRKKYAQVHKTGKNAGRPWHRKATPCVICGCPGHFNHGPHRLAGDTWEKRRWCAFGLKYVIQTWRDGAWSPTYTELLSERAPKRGGSFPPLITRKDRLS